jgi:hypothetical protein
VPKRKETEVHDGALGKPNAFSMAEVGDPGPIEQVSEAHFVEAAKLEEFMQEPVEIVVAASTDSGALEIITPNVNGINQPIVRGKPITLKRKFVEDLARCRTIVYDQLVQDPTRPENIQMVERGAVTYPFSVLNDPNPKGRAWLEAIVAQR